MKEKESIKIEAKTLNCARKHCIDNGLKLSWFVSRAVDIALECKTSLTNTAQKVVDVKNKKELEE